MPREETWYKIMFCHGFWQFQDRRNLPLASKPSRFSSLYSMYKRHCACVHACADKNENYTSITVVVEIDRKREEEGGGVRGENER